MANLVALRDGRAPRAVPTAVWSALLPTGAVAYVAWKVLESGNDTLYNDQFDSWLTTVGVATVCVAVAGVWFWRTARTRFAFAVGICLAGVACFVGLIFEVIINTGFG